MKTIVLFLLLFFLSGITYSQIERVIVETYYISDQFDSTDTDGGKLEMGSVTYRIYVDLKPGDTLLKVYGDTYHKLKFSSTKPFFNNIDGETFGKDMRKGKYTNDTYALDTWLTLGQTTRVGAITNFGILKRQDTDGSFIGGSNNNGGSTMISGGLLTNSVTEIGTPLTVADGMDTLAMVPSKWVDFGFRDFSTQIDTTIFGSVKTKSEFVSNNAYIQNSGVTGVVRDSNQILIAQLTTKGELTFELNLEVKLNGKTDTARYVADDDTLIISKNEKKNSFLKYPFPPPVCGCKDANYLEYNPNFECANIDSCITRVILGCTDSMACNFDPKANLSMPFLCCYPGSCGGRDISVVCPSVKGNSFDVDVYPNPAESNLFLNVTTGVKQEITYSIFNYFGTEVLRENLGKNDRITNYEIDLSGLNNSLYLIRVSVGGEVINKQFFKNQK